MVRQGTERSVVKSNVIRKYPMELQEFITKVLVDIATGVNHAAQETQKLGVHVGVPVYYANSEGWLTTDNKGKPAPRHIEFDIAVTVAEESGKSGGIKVVSALFGKIEQASKAESITHIRFELPVHWSTPNPQTGLNIKKL